MKKLTEGEFATIGSVAWCPPCSLPLTLNYVRNSSGLPARAHSSAPLYPDLVQSDGYSGDCSVSGGISLGLIAQGISESSWRVHAPSAPIVRKLVIRSALADIAVHHLALALVLLQIACHERISAPVPRFRQSQGMLETFCRERLRIYALRGGCRTFSSKCSLRIMISCSEGIQM